MSRPFVALTLMASMAAPAPAAAQSPPPTHEVEKLVAYDGTNNDIFGASVAAEGDLLAVGAPQYAQAQWGKVYLYRRVAGSWSLEAEWSPLVPGFAMLGADLDISGDRVVAGARFEANPSANEGAVYVWHHDGVSWSLEAHLVQFNSVVALLGAAVAIDGDVIVGGAPQEVVGGVSKGAAHVWRRVGGVWTLEATLAPSDVSSFVDFGSEIAVEGDLIAVGARSAPNSYGFTGAVYVFERSGGTWTQTAKLEGSNVGPALPHLFGDSVDIDAGRIVVGCSGFMGVFQGSGLVFEYGKVGSTWTELANLECSDVAPFYQFGGSVLLDGPRLLVGALGASAFSGEAYLFENVGGAWLERKRLVSSYLGTGALGSDVALSGDLAIVGAMFDDQVASGAGAVLGFDAALPGSVGSAYCFGDGGGTPCPCGNDAPAGSGRGCVNSSGQGAWLEAVGSTSLTTADLAPYVRDMVPKQPCLLFAGLNALNGGAGLAFGDGLRCAGGTVVRLGVGSGGATGVAAWGPAPLLAATWTPGTTVRLQAWYRDPVGGPCGQGFNLSNALELVLTP